ncbi:MAG: quinone-dependent dihydroorotate dehydrogenase [Proteobacteria bacterium]|nr:quinone-dependent dihydroorotate dehydrogenase [Pseudomonadota bacterium]
MNGTRLAQAMLRRLDPETAHDLTLWLLRRGLGPVARGADDPILATRVWGREIANPIGLAAGFDKNAAVAGPMLRLGFGFIEVGSITPAPQPGNPRPRVFRLAEDEAVINRLGFVSDGMAVAAGRLRRWRAAKLDGLIGVNLGKNRETQDAAADYAAGARALGPLADYLAINVSSPNTPGLRALQGRAELRRIVDAVRAALAQAVPEAAPPLLVKIAPDLTEADMADIAAVALEPGVAGLIVGNTTIARPAGLTGRHRAEAGGLSGRPLFAGSTAVLGGIYRLTEGRVPLVGVGGVASAADAYAKIRAGASLVQLYTALVYQGPGLVARIKTGLAELLRRDGFTSLADAVGADHR